MLDFEGSATSEPSSERARFRLIPFGFSGDSIPGRRACERSASSEVSLRAGQKSSESELTCLRAFQLDEGAAGAAGTDFFDPFDLAMANERSEQSEEEKERSARRGWREVQEGPLSLCLRVLAEDQVTPA
jgi:hypothetical protein